jgi:hypothetical protein
VSRIPAPIFYRPMASATAELTTHSGSWQPNIRSDQ